MKTINTSINSKIKVIYFDSESNITTESIWAQKEKEFYRIKSIPFRAPNLSYHDLIMVEDNKGELFFDGLVEISGHTTLHLVFNREEDVKEVTKALKQLRCDWEISSIRSHISVDIPKDVDYREVKKYLDHKQSLKQLNYKEACLAHSVYFK